MPVVAPANSLSGPNPLGGGGVISPSQLDVLPEPLAASVTETSFPYVVDVSNYLSGNDTITNTASVLYLASTGAKLTSGWQVSITVSGSIITVLMDVSKLQLGQIYYIVTTFTASSIKQPTYISTIEVVA